MGIHPSSPDAREQTAVRHAPFPKVHGEDGSCFVTRESVRWGLGGGFIVVSHVIS